MSILLQEPPMRSLAAQGSFLKLEFDQILTLRTSLVLDHPLNRFVGHDQTKLFRMFELYAHFVYGFSAYVCKLFLALHDDAMKAEIYENLADEMGFHATDGLSWKNQHGELYRQFIQSLRNTRVYHCLNLRENASAIESKSAIIANRFYSAHAEIISDNNDLQSFAAFSTIECWVADQYAFWKSALQNLGDDCRPIDFRTIDLHCICDAAHSASLDRLIGEKTEILGIESYHHVKKGLIRGMLASEQLFADIMKAIE